MRLSVILRTLGVLFLLFSTTLLPPIAISFYYNDGELARFTYDRTDGNPLFVVALADDLVRTGALAQSGGAWRLARPVAEIGLAIPATVQTLIGQQISLAAAGSCGSTLGSVRPAPTSTSWPRAWDPPSRG